MPLPHRTLTTPHSQPFARARQLPASKSFTAETPSFPPFRARHAAALLPAQVAVPLLALLRLRVGSVHAALSAAAPALAAAAAAPLVAAARARRARARTPGLGPAVVVRRAASACTAWRAAAAVCAAVRRGLARAVWERCVCGEVWNWETGGTAEMRRCTR